MKGEAAIAWKPTLLITALGATATPALALGMARAFASGVSGMDWGAAQLGQGLLGMLVGLILGFIATITIVAAKTKSVGHGALAVVLYVVMIPIAAVGWVVVLRALLSDA
jgi:hypothetical protein